MISTNYEAYHHHHHHHQPSCYRSIPCPPPLSHTDTPPRMTPVECIFKYYLLCKFVCGNQCILVLCCIRYFFFVLLLLLLPPPFLPPPSLGRSGGLVLYYHGIQRWQSEERARFSACLHAFYHYYCCCYDPSNPKQCYLEQLSPSIASLKKKKSSSKN